MCWVYVRIRTVDLEEDHRWVKMVHPFAADAVPGLTVVPPAMIRLHVRDDVVLPQPDEAPFPVEAVPTVSHLGAGVAVALENHRTSFDDVPGWTDRQGYSVRRIWWRDEPEGWRKQWNMDREVYVKAGMAYFFRPLFYFCFSLYTSVIAAEVKLIHLTSAEQFN